MSQRGKQGVEASGPRARRVLSARSPAELRRRLAAPLEQRREWLREHGVERLLELAFVPTLPPGLELKALRQLAPGLELVEAQAPAPGAEPEAASLVSALVAREESDEELQGRLEAILVDTWEAEDWDAFIRNPKLLEDEVLSEEQLDDWKRRLAENGRSST